MENILEAIQKDLNIPSFSMKCRESGEQLSINVFNGRVGLTVWPPRESNVRGVVFKQSMTPEALMLLKRSFKKVLESNEPIRDSILFNVWSDSDKKFTPNASVILGKDDKGIYFMEIQFKHNGNNKVLKFDFLASNAVQSSSDEMGFPERSKLRMEAIIEFLHTIVPIAQIVTSRKISPQGGNRGGSGGGGGGAPGGFGANNSY